MVAALGLMMFAPMIVDYYFGDRSWQTFGLSAILTSLMGAVMATAAYTPEPNLGARGAFLLTVLSWVALSFFAAIPFLMDPMKLSFTDALFEATSGITTTGATAARRLYRQRHWHNLSYPHDNMRDWIYVGGDGRI